MSLGSLSLALSAAVFMVIGCSEAAPNDDAPVAGEGESCGPIGERGTTKCGDGNLCVYRRISPEGADKPTFEQVGTCKRGATRGETCGGNSGVVCGNGLTCTDSTGASIDDKSALGICQPS